MPITILDYVKAKTGTRETYSEQDHWRAGVAMLGGCQGCHATIASYNAYPSRNGYWRCANCIGSHGFATVAEFEGRSANCPSCGNIDAISEYWILAAGGTEESGFECGACGEAWQ